MQNFCHYYRYAGIKKKKPVTLGVARIQSIASIPDGSPGNRDVGNGPNSFYLKVKSSPNVVLVSSNVCYKKKCAKLQMSHFTRSNCYLPIVTGTLPQKEYQLK